MLLIYKNKGILVPIYFVASMVAVLLINFLLEEYVGGIFLEKYDKSFIVFAIACIVAGIWTRVTYDSYYYTNDGERKAMQEDNSFYYVPMKLWANIYFVTGALFLVFGFWDLVEGS
jgi:hypothetical protein